MTDLASYETKEIQNSGKHTFYVQRYPDYFIAEFRPLHPKTGKPWQASHSCDRDNRQFQTFAAAASACTAKFEAMR